MSQSKTDIAIAKAFAMQDAGKSDDEIIAWIEKQPNSDEIFEAFSRIVEAFSVKKSCS